MAFINHLFLSVSKLRKFKKTDKEYRKDMDNITPQEALIWMAKLAAVDGVISPNERKVLSDFANIYNLDADYINSIAEDLACRVDVPEVLPLDANEIKGLLFEQFVVSLLNSKCKLQNWRGDKMVNNTYAAENLYPDLKIKHKLDAADVEYFVECKFRSSWGRYGIDISEQFNRYRRYAKESGLELFIALGIGGHPSKPKEFYIIPGRMIRLDKRIDRYRFKKCLCGKTTEEYHSYLNNYYNKLASNTNSTHKNSCPPKNKK